MERCPLCTSFIQHSEYQRAVNQMGRLPELESLNKHLREAAKRSQARIKKLEADLAKAKKSTT